MFVSFELFTLWLYAPSFSLIFFWILKFTFNARLVKRNSSKSILFKTLLKPIGTYSCEKRKTVLICFSIVIALNWWVVKRIEMSKVTCFQVIPGLTDSCIFSHYISKPTFYFFRRLIRYLCEFLKQLMEMISNKNFHLHEGLRLSTLYWLGLGKNGYEAVGSVGIKDF